MKEIGEVKVVIAGSMFDKNMPVKGTLTFTMPNGSLVELDVLDILETDWYDEIA